MTDGYAYQTVTNVHRLSSRTYTIQTENLTPIRTMRLRHYMVWCSDRIANEEIYKTIYVWYVHTMTYGGEWQDENELYWRFNGPRGLAGMDIIGPLYRAERIACLKLGKSMPTYLMR